MLSAAARRGIIESVAIIDASAVRRAVNVHRRGRGVVLERSEPVLEVVPVTEVPVAICPQERVIADARGAFERDFPGCVGASQVLVQVHLVRGRCRGSEQSEHRLAILAARAAGLASERRLPRNPPSPRRRSPAGG